MPNADEILDALVQMSLALGRPERDLAILGEGNTSAAVGDGTFWVKASGTQLPTASRDSFVRLWLEPVRALADAGEMSDEAFKAALDAAKVDPSAVRRPSTETVLHALALTEFGARFVGHTHPVAVNAIMCSVAAETALAGRLFPDEIVVCGPAPAYVPYADPGLPLARCVREVCHRYADTWGMMPKVIAMQNHGLIALGGSPEEVDHITAMFVKTCRVLAGTYAFGGPHFLSAENVERIHTRPDEAYRRRELHIR
ncbi:MAG: class II aldolase/adducin family protein [Chloroflexi bacterium]|nr:class II aldolase/adducin family protein [Chloroflexota bacterium]